MLNRLSDRAKNILIMSMVAMNLGMFALTFQPVRERIPFAFFDCCQGPICCPSCCWFTNDCDTSQDCGPG